MKQASLIFFIFMLFLMTAQEYERPDYVEHEMKRAQKRLHFRANPHTGNYDLTYQRMHWHVDPRNYYISGEVDAHFSLLADAQDIVFDLSNALTVNQVVYHGQPVSFQHQNDELKIFFPSTLTAGTQDSLRIDYEGAPGTSGFQSFVTDQHNGVPVLWTLSEPYGARDWWPTKQDLIDKIDSIDVFLHYPEQINGEIMQGVSNGILVNETVQGGTKISHWRHRHPIPAYLVAIAVTNYTHYAHQAGLFTPFPIDNYVYPEDLSYAQTKTPVTVDVMNYYENTFGEYPFSDEKYGHAEFGWGGGMEHTTISFVGGFSRGLIAHELAHQWFGDDVTCGSWHDIWLNEGFATFSEALIQRHLDGNNAFISWKIYANNLIIQRPHGSVYVYDTTNVGAIFDWRTTYLKGAMVLNMLRFKLGENAFFNALNQYRQQYSGSYARTDDFKNVLETSTGEDLDEFFNDWVYGKGYPSYQVTWQNLSGNLYRVTIDQTTSDASVSFFEMPLKLRFTDANQSQVFDTIVNHTQNGQQFLINPGFEVSAVILDPSEDIIKGQVTYLNAGQFYMEDDIRIFPNPATDKIYVVLKNESVLKIMLYDISGKLIRDRIHPGQEVDVSNLSRGVYILQAYYRDSILSTKFIKQ